MAIKKYLWILISLVLVAGCESLEDTYSDYAGDGAIRYLGKCTKVSVAPGWKRLIVKWVNNVDPVIDKIKVRWQVNDMKDSILLAPNTTEYSIPDLEDGNYEVTVCAIDKNGNESLANPIFGRPYTPTHETIISFTRLISKHYFVKKRLVLFFSTWQENISSAQLNYYTADGNVKTLELTSELMQKKYYLLPEEIDPDKPVILNREGQVEGCDDLIVFDPYQLSRDKLYTSDFKHWLKAKYGQSEISEEFIESLRELEYDYSLSSFEDILNLPNLEKLVLGKNRYLRTDMADQVPQSELYDLERSLFVLDVANTVCGLAVDRYNKHYIPDENLPAYVTKKSNPTQPALTCLDASTWEYTCSEEDKYPYNSNLENLFDGQLDNWWQPELISTLARTYEITVDMKQVQTIHGIKIVQKAFDKAECQSASVMPGMIKVKVSTNKISWEDATYVEENTIGATNGETTILYFPNSPDVRYFKFIVNDQVYGQNFSVSLAEIGVF